MTAAGAEPHRLAVRVYYEDTDFSGVVYHANYLRFFERGRTEFLRQHGVAHSALHAGRERPLAFVVRRIAIDFRGAARMDDALTVETRIEALGGASIEMGQAILRAGAVLVMATVKIGVVEGGRARRLPNDLVAALRQPILRQDRPGKGRPG